MAKKKYYVVWKGVTPGIYSSWEECQAQIAGVQALYKSFNSVFHTVNGFYFFAVKTSFYYTCKGCIDCGGRTARLS